jgi:hypothetical protein
MPIDCRPLASWCHKARPARDESRKPSNWWAFEREPWKRIRAEIAAREKAAADRDRADHALRSAFAFAGAALGIAMAKVPPVVVPKGLNLGELTDLYTSLGNSDLRAIVAAMAAIDAESSPALYGGNDDDARPPTGDDYNDLWYAVLGVLEEARTTGAKPLACEQDDYRGRYDRI